MGLELKRVVITGIGVLSPVGLSLGDFWKSLMEGKSGAAPISYFDTTGFATTFACELKNFKADEYIDRKSADRMDPYCQYGVISAEHALKDSGLDLTSIDPTRIGVVHGSGIGGMTVYDQQFRQYLERGPRRVSPFFIPMLIPDIAAGQISIRNGLMGPNYATASACATSLHGTGPSFLRSECGVGKQWAKIVFTYVRPSSFSKCFIVPRFFRENQKNLENYEANDLPALCEKF